MFVGICSAESPTSDGTHIVKRDFSTRLETQVKAQSLTTVDRYVSKVRGVVMEVWWAGLGGPRISTARTQVARMMVSEASALSH